MLGWLTTLPNLHTYIWRHIISGQRNPIIDKHAVSTAIHYQVQDAAAYSNKLDRITATLRLLAADAYR